jgi:hypothetical protein
VQVLSGHLKKGNITYVKSVRRDSWSSEEPFQAGIVSMQMVVSLRSKTMPGREILTSSERMQLLALPDDEGELIRK